MKLGEGDVWPEIINLVFIETDVVGKIPVVNVILVVLGDASGDVMRPFFRFLKMIKKSVWKSRVWVFQEIGQLKNISLLETKRFIGPRMMVIG